MGSETSKELCGERVTVLFKRKGDVYIEWRNGSMKSDTPQKMEY